VVRRLTGNRTSTIVPEHPPRRLTVDTRTRLQQAGDNRRSAERQLADATRQIRNLIPRAHGEGMTVTEISRLAGVSRQTVYAMLAEVEA
jgi:DNA-directed RNA polymerase specialized sigma24 family protein